ncbi:TMV resistance protein N [Dorcoceras hygrometricum]|uniref:TMV resistance protein N n=1 Tax=Dorcoceras hygrometricum TaxID=472368 RepID=A0A2Z7D609_9LAMI|nr:TMV resistance protein N [Dorcoceras hygrometricum]
MATSTAIKVFVIFLVLALPMNLSSPVPLHKESMDNKQLLRKLGLEFTKMKILSHRNGVERFLREVPVGINENPSYAVTLHMPVILHMHEETQYIDCVFNIAT